MEEPPTIIASRLAEVSPLVDILTEQSPSLQLLTTPGSKGYLSHLSTLPLTELLQEPVSLQTQSHHLTSSLTSLTHTSYPTFISLHKTTTALTSSLDSLSSSLNNLLDSSLPELEESTGVWKERTEAVLRERNKARVVLEQHEKIRDLLDIPVLIDTCVRNGYFGEALSLASHVATLTSSFHKVDDKSKDKSPPPAILTSVFSEVQHSIIQMHLSLLATLYEPSRKLPALWKAVNFLRKMDAFGSGSAALPFVLHHHKTPPSTHQVTATRGQCEEPSSEEQLALAFLIGRESCLKTILESSGRDIQRLVEQVTVSESGDGTGVDGGTQGGGKSKGKAKELDEREKEDMARYLKKYIDAWREGVYDVITQYSTIFLERSSTSSSSEASGGHHSEDQLPRLHTLLRSYSIRALTTHLFAKLTSSFPLLSLSHLPSLLTQLNYCSTAFARLGLDFRCILLGGGGIFSSAILAIVKRDFENATKKWVGRIEKARGTTTKSDIRGLSASSSRGNPTPAESPSKWLILPSLITSPPFPPSSKHQTSSGPPHIPPQILASYPPIAELTNAVLGVLNGLRLVVPRNPQAGGATNGNAMNVNGIADVEVNAEGVNELLRMLDEIVLGQGAAGLLGYLRIVVTSQMNEDSPESEKEKEKERERKVIVAVGRVFFEVFGPFVRRALVEGVYGVKIGEKPREEEWSKLKAEFEKLLRVLDDDEDDDEDDDGEDDGESEDESEEE